MKLLFDFLNNHGTKIIGYIAAIAGGIAVADKELVARTLGSDATDWALLITGILALLRGHQSTAREKAASTQGGFVKLKLLIVLAIASMTALTLPACQTLDEHGATVKLAITYATMKYIDASGPAAAVNRAARVAAFANQALNAVEGDGFELSAFKAHIMQNLAPDLSTADRVLAVALIDVIAQELQLRIGEGVLTPETRVKAKQVLTWIHEATAYYEG
jgi:hypothetical protein